MGQFEIGNVRSEMTANAWPIDRKRKIIIVIMNCWNNQLVSNMPSPKPEAPIFFLLTLLINIVPWS